MSIWQKIICGVVACSLSIAAFGYGRIVVLSGDVGDIVVAMGAASQVVGKDDTNKNPALAHAKTVGIHRNLSVEPIVALQPDLVLGSYMVMPNSIYNRLVSLKVKAVNVMPDETVASYTKAITTTGELLGKKTQAEALAKKWSNDMASKPATKKRYLLSYDGRIVAGAGTVGDELIKRAGGINAANISGLKPLSREGWLAAKADVIIVAEHHKATLGTLEQFKLRPEIAANPAASTGKIYFWPAGDFLTFGLDSPQVLARLHALAK